MSRHASILLVAAVLAFFVGLGRGAIGDSDEAFYAEAAREMTESGDWLTPKYNYDVRFQKPILYYWLAAAAYEVAGLSEEAARAPAALSGLALVLVTWLCARRHYGADAALLAGLVVATNFGYFTMARMALPDLPLALFITVATWAVVESIDAGRLGRPRDARAWLLGAAVAAAMGVLMKGPVAVALPGLVAMPLLARRTSGRFVWPWRGLDLVLAAGLFVLFAAPWYLAMARVHGTAYLHQFFVGENLDRFATDRYNDPRPVWFYVPIVFGGLLPWSTFLVPWAGTLARVWRRTRTIAPVEWTLLVWAAVPLLFYSLSIGKQPRYILPVLPPLAILLAASITARVDADDQGRVRTLSWCATASAAILLVFGALLHRGKPLLFALDPNTGVVATILIVLVGLGLLALAWLGRRTWIPLGVAVASALTLLSVHYSIYSAAGIEPVQKMAASFKTAWPGAAESGTYRVFVRNLVFYTGVKQTDLRDLDAFARFLSRPERVVAVAREEDLAQLETVHGVRARRLEKVTYFNAAGLRLRTLLNPRPEKDLETVWLVSNR